MDEGQLLTIAVPVRNGSGYLEGTIESVLEQVLSLRYQYSRAIGNSLALAILQSRANGNTSPASILDDIKFKLAIAPRILFFLAAYSPPVIARSLLRLYLHFKSR